MQQIPQVPEPWTEVKYSPSYGNACPSSKKLFLLTQPTFNNFDEDCLNLNVATSVR
jgi:carboxylesterase type B